MFKNNGSKRKPTGGYWEVAEVKTQRIDDEDANALGRRLNPINVASNASVPRASNLSKAVGSRLSANSSAAGNDYNGIGGIPTLPFELTGEHPPTSHANPQDHITDCRRYPDFAGASPYFFPRQQHDFLPGYNNQHRDFNTTSRRENHPDLEPEIPFGGNEFRPS